MMTAAAAFSASSDAPNPENSSGASSGTVPPAAVPSAPLADSLAGFPPMLLGTYTPTMDSKGRLALPAKFRSQITGSFVLARGQERCIYLLPAAEFRRMAARIQNASVGNRATRDYLRIFLSGAVEETADKQGRVVIPPMLRTYAGLAKDVVVIGVGTRAELWDAQAWNTYLAAKEEDYSEIADDVLPAMEL